MRTWAPGADRSYKARRGRAYELLDLLRDGLDRHATYQANDPRNWGYVSDLAETALRLQQALAMLPGEKR